MAIHVLQQGQHHAKTSVVACLELVELWLLHTCCMWCLLAGKPVHVPGSCLDATQFRRYSTPSVMQRMNVCYDGAHRRCSC